MKRADLYTDGSCIGNPGPGGWAFLARITPSGANPIEHRGQGGEADTTNNRMELTAVIRGLEWLEEHHPKVEEVSVHSDSSWVVSTMNDNWKRKKNLDLWAELTPFLGKRRIKWKWVRGHSGHKENEDCDRRAQKEALKQRIEFFG